MNKKLVSLYRDVEASYPKDNLFFRPSESYPEYIFGNDICIERNLVYELVRNNLLLLGLDSENANTQSWNPLGGIISKGDNVVVKPNLVMDFNPSGDGTDCLVTHPSVICAVIDYVLIALNGKGSIVIGDAPMQECNFEKLKKEQGYNRIIEYYKSKIVEYGWDIEIKLVDFRGFTSTVKHGVSIGREKESNGIVVNLSEDSEFSNYGEEKLKKLRITNYNPDILIRHHNVEKHEYFISREVLNADVIINMPKPKTHRKAGVTIALKNLIGINVRKEYLPHHSVGEKYTGGDEYLNKSLFKQLKSKLQDCINRNQANNKYVSAFFMLCLRKILSLFIRVFEDSTWEGSWYGNETISKTITDLNKIVLFADKRGKLQSEKQRKLFIVADMIISGEKEGPICPTAKPVGLIAMGMDALSFDEVISTIMGMDVEKIPTIRQVKSIVGKYKLYEDDCVTSIVSNCPCWDGKSIKEIRKEDTLLFMPSEGWACHIEL